MARLPSLTALKAFEAAARHQSLTIAAVELSVSQSAISKHVQLVEGHFGRKLFERKGPRLELTLEGAKFCKDLGTAFKMLEAACLNVSRNDFVLRLKAPTSISIRWALDSINHYHEINGPGLVRLESAWMDVELFDFSKEPYDIAIQYGNGIFPPHWGSIKLFGEFLVPLCSPKYLDSDKVISVPVALLHASHEKHDWELWQRKSPEQLKLSIRDELVFDTMDLAITAAVRGFGITVGDALLAESEMASGSLVQLSEHIVPSGQGYYLVWPKSSSKESQILKFGKHLVDTLSK